MDKNLRIGGHENFIFVNHAEMKLTNIEQEIEKDILKENTSKLSYLANLFHYVFSFAKAMCGIFLGLSMALILSAQWYNRD